MLPTVHEAGLWKLHSISLKTGLGRSTLVLRNERVTASVQMNTLDLREGEDALVDGCELSEERLR